MDGFVQRFLVQWNRLWIPAEYTPGLIIYQGFLQRILQRYSLPILYNEFFSVDFMGSSWKCTLEILLRICYFSVILKGSLQNFQQQYFWKSFMHSFSVLSEKNSDILSVIYSEISPGTARRIPFKIPPWLCPEISARNCIGICREILVLLFSVALAEVPPEIPARFHTDIPLGFRSGIPRFRHV